MFTSPYFRGVITDTPSGAAYSVAPGQTVAADDRDVALLVTFGFTAAPPAVGGGGTSLSIYDQSGDSVTSVGTITFQGVTVSGSSPSGIVNMTTITGANAISGTVAQGIRLAGGNAVFGQSGVYNLDAGYVFMYGGLGACANAYIPGTYYAGGVRITGGIGGKGLVGIYGGLAGYSKYGGGPVFLSGGFGNATYSAYGQGGSAVVIGGNSHGTFNGAPVSLHGGSADSGAAGDVELNPGTSNTGPNGAVKVNGDPSLIKLATLSWVAGETLNARTIGISIRAALVTAVIVRLDAANGASGTLVVNQCPSGTAPADGTVLTSDSADLNGTPNTNQTLTLSATLTDIQIDAGTAFCTTTTGTLTLSAGCVEVWGTPQ